MTKEKCVFCRIKKAKQISGYVEHHLDGSKTGETIDLCNYHHRNFHGFIRKRAIALCCLIYANFFKHVTEEYKESLKDDD